MTNKERYKALCEEQGSNIPLFQQHWWMDAVCHGKQWDVILVENHGEIVAALPYLIGKKLWMRFILQPELAQYNGIWYKEQNFNNEIKQLSFEKWAANKVIEQLHKLNLSYYEQCFHHKITNWLPFYWNNYKQTTKYTYRINDISNLDKVFENFDKKNRQKPILKASESLEPVWDITPETFYDFHSKYWENRGQKDLISKEFALRICNTAIGRGQGFIMGMKDKEGELIATRFVVYDSSCAYSLMSALNPNGHPNGTSATTYWEIIKHLSGKTKAFDFEGSMDEGIETAYRLYGGSQTPYFKIYKSNSITFQLLKTLKERRII